MLTVIVGNKRRGDSGIYVGRPTPLGNPYPLPRGYDTEADPHRILPRYREWLVQKLADPGSPQARAFAFLKGFLQSEGIVALTCW